MINRNNTAEQNGAIHRAKMKRKYWKLENEKVSEQVRNDFKRKPYQIDSGRADKIRKESGI